MKTSQFPVIMCILLKITASFSSESIHTNLKNFFLYADPTGKQYLCSPHISEKIVKNEIQKIKKNRQIESTVTVDTFILHDADTIQYMCGFSKPKVLKKNTLYPLLVYLHGGINTAHNTKGMDAFHMFDFISDSIDIFLVSPSANSLVPWWSDTGLKRIMATVRYMTYHFPIDPDRILLAGVSDGAAGCFAAANTINSIFAGFIAVSGFGGILPQLGVSISLTNLKKRPLYVINGGKDHLYPIDLVNQFHMWLRNNSVPIITKIYPSEKHGFDYRIQERQSIIAFVSTWSKPLLDSISWERGSSQLVLTDNILSIEKNTITPLKTYIYAHWKSDTLYCATQGIQSFIIIAPQNKKKYPAIVVYINNKQHGSYKLYKPSMDQICEQLLHNSTFEDAFSSILTFTGIK